MLWLVLTRIIHCECSDILAAPNKLALFCLFVLNPYRTNVENRVSS